MIGDNGGGSIGAGKSKYQSLVGSASALVDSSRSKHDGTCAFFMLPGIFEGGRIIAKGLKRLPGVAIDCVRPRRPTSAGLGNKAEPGKENMGGTGTLWSLAR